MTHFPGALPRRRLLGAALLLPLAACQSLQPGPRHIEISELKLMQLMVQRFPLRQRHLGLVDLTLDQPRLRLMPQEDRIGTELNYRVATLVPGLPAMQGLMGLSYGLRFEPSDRTLRLTQVRLETLGVDGLSASQVEQVRQLAGSLLAGELLQEMVVHQLRAEDLEAVGRRGYRPGVLKVVPGGVRLVLEPLPR
jgi:hypothetical protein